MRVTQPMIFFLLVLATTFLGGCNNTSPEEPVNPEIKTGTLSMLNSYPLSVTEPSGLAFGPDKKTLLTVSDNTNEVVELTLTGEFIRKWSYQGNDLEGITYNPRLGVIAIVEERERDVVILDYNEDLILGTFHIDIPMGSDNNGLEGIAYSYNNDLYYIVNEANPGEMILWSPDQGIIDETNLDFAEDYSGIFIDSQNALIWIVSDMSMKLFACDYSGQALVQYDLPDTKYEGIVIDNISRQALLVNDAAATLTIFEIKSN